MPIPLQRGWEGGISSSSSWRSGVQYTVHSWTDGQRSELVKTKKGEKGILMMKQEPWEGPLRPARNKSRGRKRIRAHNITQKKGAKIAVSGRHMYSIIAPSLDL